MSGLYGNKRKRQLLTGTSSDIEPGALILSGDAAHVDYEDQVPVWKQEVVDDRGRKRLHGAFSGGFSAGYFNTVGSAEGWTPSTFVSSRTSRHKANDKKAVDYMDEEDLADIVGDRELKLRLETEAALLAQTEIKMDLSKHRAKSAERPDPEAFAKPSTIVQALVKHQNKRASARPVSQFEDGDEHDIDAFDIDPRIKYDQILIKKSKKKSAASHHVFQTKKVLKNPAPEPETVQRPAVPERSAFQTQTPTQLPSIGDWTPHAKSQSADHNSFLNNAENTTSSSHSMKSTEADIGDSSATDPIPPWRQVSHDREAKVPPWRQNQGPKSSVASIGQATAFLALQSTFTPYTSNTSKHERYQEYLRIEAGVQPGPHKQHDLEPDTWKAECEEFRKCALMYKPMTGAMSLKFTSSIHKDKANHDIEENSSGSEMLTGSVAAERLGAARAGKFGHMTRSIEYWSPSKLLCKRYNVLHPGADRLDSDGMQQEPSATDIHRSALESLMKTT